MTTVRQRLTRWYALALALALVAFGGALYLERERSVPVELDQRLALEADFAVRGLAESRRVLGGLVVDNDGTPALEPGVSAYFEGIRDILVVVAPDGRVLFLSEEARNLPVAALERLVAAARPRGAEPVAGTLDLGPPRGAARFIARYAAGAGPEVAGILVATPFDTVTFGPRDLLRSMFLAAPLTVLLALALGYWLAGRVLAPVDGIMDEVEAISDGRSLHRRLAVPRSGDELQRLALTVNGMLARLEQSFASLRRFTADASHELKTPLMVLRAGVERALTHPRTPREVMGALDETLEEINRMSELVDSLLTLARADEGRAPLAVERTDLRELVAEAAETAEMLGEGQDVRVTSEIPPQPVWIDADRHRLRELLLNLTTNAIKYTPAGGSVALLLQELEENVALVVKDTGIGIAPGDLPHIFERFWRADPARSRTGDRPGTGLGLAITKWIAEAHGGTITVQSRPGRGTTFTVTLPRPRAGAEVPAA